MQEKRMQMSLSVRQTDKLLQGRTDLQQDQDESWKNRNGDEVNVLVSQS